MINGEDAFYNLEVDKSSMNEVNELLMIGNNSISNLLTVLNGDLTVQTGNTLRLISSQANKAAALGPIPPASTITGDFIVERYLPPVSTVAPPNSGNGVGWRYLSAPITNATFASWNDDFITTGLTNSNYPNYLSYGYYFPNIQFYNESIAGLQNKGFDGDANGVAPTIRERRDINEAVAPGQAVFAYLGPVPLTLDVQGTPFVGDLSVNVDYTNSGFPLEDGWNLIANPYPSAIDWKIVNRSAGVGSFAYVYDATGSGNYVVIDALATGNQLIASSSAFWVKTSQQGTIDFQESDKSSIITAAFYKNADKAFNELYVSILNVNDSSLNDQTRIRFMEEASNDYDVLYDAPKRFSLNSSVPGIATMIDTNNYAINSYSINDSILSIPLKANIRTAGTYQFSFDIAGDYFDGQCLVLHDLFTNEQIVVAQNVVYEFESSTNQIEDNARFELVFKPTIEIETVDASCFNGTNGSIEIQSFGEGPFTYSVYNGQGELVSLKILSGNYEYNELAYGFYSVIVDGLDGACSSVQRDFYIGQPQQSEAHEVLAYNTECKDGYDGEILLLLSDSLNYDLQLFRDNELQSEASSIIAEYAFSSLTEGIYRVDLINACDTISYTKEVMTNDSMLLDFIIVEETIYLQDGGEVFFENTSVNSEVYEWYFHEGQTEPFLATDGEFTFTEAGSYDIYLVGKTAAGCQRYIYKTLEVIDLASGVEEIDKNGPWTQVRYASNSIDLYFNNYELDKLQITVINELGQTLSVTSANPSGVHRINTANLQAGIYFVRINNEVRRFVVN
jgi:hypothetical protein